MILATNCVRVCICNSLLTSYISVQNSFWLLPQVIKVAPPSTFSLGNGRNSMVCNSGTQQAIVIKLEISAKYLIQYILGENPGNPTLLIN